MIAFLVLLVAALSRLVPHAMHGVSINFTAVAAGLLFFGARRPRWQAVIGMAVMAATDIFLTTQVYGREFHVQHYLITWAWYAALCLMGSALLRKVTTLRVATAVLASATGFFLWSNTLVWLGTQADYPHTLRGLGLCLAAGLPFYRNDLVSTALFTGALFGLPLLAARLVETMRTAQERNQPLM